MKHATAADTHGMCFAHSFLHGSRWHLERTSILNGGVTVESLLNMLDVSPSQHQFWTSVKCMWHTTFFNLLLFGGDAVRVCLPLTTTSNTPRHQALRQTMGYHNPNKWGGVSPNKLTSQPDILLMAQVPPNNTQQCSAAHFGRQSSILSWRRVWHGQHARFCFLPTVLPCWLWKADCEQKSHIQHFKVGTTTIWFDNNHDIKNTKKNPRVNVGWLFTVRWVRHQHL